MSEQRWQQVKQLVGEALELPSAQRAAHVQAACAGDAALAAEVLALLAQSGATERFDSGPPASAPLEADSYWIGRQLGPYRIVSEMGSGGMGRVFEAERTDGAFAGRVAIKILRANVDSAEGRVRFNAERQILAQLRHPRIASLLDGGTIDRLPYFVMEYVQGSPIDRYCSAHQLDLRARLQLFQTICDAVEFAHQQLIVHRDLKPDNILVTEDGHLKLLDFGIAKLMDQDAANQAALTRFGGPGPYTLAYAAPEQLRAEAISTGTDVYSLGCVLFLLLTGRLPFQVGNGDLNWISTICEQAPPKPSSVIEAGPHALRAQDLRGDLDQIILKALEKEQTQRYRTVAELRADVGRYLAGRIVSARPPSLAYVAGKFIRRNRLAVATGSVALLAAIAGVSGVLWQAQIAETMRQRADKRLSDVQNMAQRVIFEYNDKISALPGGLPVSQVLMADVSQFLDQLNSESALPQGLRRDLASAYARLANVQGGFRMNNIGDGEAGSKSRAKAAQLLEQLLREVDSSQPEQRRLVLLQLAQLESDTEADKVRVADFKAARQHIERAVALTDEAAKIAPAPMEQATVWTNLAIFVAHHEGDFQRALTLAHRVEQMMLALLAKDPNDYEARDLLSNVLIGQGLYLQDGKIDRAAARQMFDRGIEQDRLLHQARPLNTEATIRLASDLLRAANLDLLDQTPPGGKALLDEAQAALAPLLQSDKDNLQLAFVAAMVNQGIAMYHLRSGQLELASSAVGQMEQAARHLLAIDSQSYDNRYYDALTGFTRARVLILQEHYGAAEEVAQRTSAGLHALASQDKGMARRLLHWRLEFAESMAEKKQWDRVLTGLKASPWASAPLSERSTDSERQLYGRYAMLQALAWRGKAEAASGAQQSSWRHQARQYLTQVVDALQPLIDRNGGADGDRQRYKRARSLLEL